MTTSVFPVRTAVPTRPGSGYTRGELTIHHEPSALHAVTESLRKVGKQVVFVPTMGALHEGHLALVEAARRTPGSVVVVSIFVNPLQFGPGEDLDAYPRTLDQDVARLASAGVELVFAPSAAAMYPDGPRTTVQPGPTGDILDGAARPGHFAGMLTVVAKLFNIVSPHQAFFGEKDYQQLVLIRQMVADLDMDVRVVGVPTVRESDGLAMSSRNRYLSEEERQQTEKVSAVQKIYRLNTAEKLITALKGSREERAILIPGTPDERSACISTTSYRLVRAARMILEICARSVPRVIRDDLT